MPILDKLQGTLYVYETLPDGQKRLASTNKNTITQVGKDFIARTLFGYDACTGSVLDPFTRLPGCKTSISYCKYGITQLSNITPIATAYTDNDLVNPISFVKNAANKNIFEIPNQGSYGMHIWPKGGDANSVTPEATSNLYSYDSTIGVANISYEFPLRYADLVPAGTTGTVLTINEIGLFLATYAMPNTTTNTGASAYWAIYGATDPITGTLANRQLHLVGTNSDASQEAMFCRVSCQPIVLTNGSAFTLIYKLPL